MICEIGILPYSERLEALQLTTLAERRIRGDLIETFKIVNNIVSYGRNIFKLGRSGYNILSKPVNNNNDNRDIKKIIKSFLSERVITYWNKLPSYVKKSACVDSFKVNLQCFKVANISQVDTGNFWEVSRILLTKIEGTY